MGMSGRLVVLLSLAVLSQVAWGSAYPPGYAHQNVRVLHQGPALFAHVGSGVGSYQVIGYRFTGMLAETEPESVTAVITGTCGDVHKVSVVELGKEWNGSGFASYGLSFYDLVPWRDCSGGATREGRIKVAFTANGQWDSLDGADYGHYTYGFYQDSFQIEFFATNQPGYGKINESAWQFIAEQLRL